MVLPPNAASKMRVRSSAGSFKSGDVCSFRVEIALLEAGDSCKFSSLGGLFSCGISRLDIVAALLRWLCLCVESLLGVASTWEACCNWWFVGLDGSLGAVQNYSWNGQGLEGSLVNGIATSTGSQVGCEKGIHLQDESHCR
jgi:hypothetical protein